ncbi:MAG: hypothetical protein BGP09_27230 [Rhizobium sp. 60-20]|jgi:hypothetical protein|nr:MAG: hypothetical protein BGP09_27230 [Rhizobium sp. 60-20]RKD61479.1 hypothetical protein BJ928_10780 [Rhizobium sp. WW_1]
MRPPSLLHGLALAVAFMPGLISCASAENATTGAAALARPNVVMAADPPPPFTYWAPENSTIRNHPRQPGIWIAESPGGGRKYYFGDQCRASEFQRFVGKPLDRLPAKPADATWRLTCSTCAATSDLGWTRMNVTYDEKTRTIAEIACG